MNDQGIAVRSWVFDNKNWCRVSIGRKTEMQSFIEALKLVHKV
jgi:histidinol-phosphate aminotransferase